MSNAIVGQSLLDLSVSKQLRRNGFCRINLRSSQATPKSKCDKLTAVLALVVLVWSGNRMWRKFFAHFFFQNHKKEESG